MIGVNIILVSQEQAMWKQFRAERIHQATIQPIKIRLASQVPNRIRKRCELLDYCLRQVSGVVALRRSIRVLAFSKVTHRALEDKEKSRSFLINFRKAQ
jgi:hypothetical protein